jgi:hypothetical protein
VEDERNVIGATWALINVSVGELKGMMPWSIQIQLVKMSISHIDI